MEVLRQRERERERERALQGLASDHAQRQKADNGLTIVKPLIAGSVSAIRDVGLIRRSPAKQTIVFECVMLSVNPKTKPGYIHLICYTLNCAF